MLHDLLCCTKINFGKDLYSYIHSIDILLVHQHANICAICCLYNRSIIYRSITEHENLVYNMLDFYPCISNKQLTKGIFIERVLGLWSSSATYLFIKKRLEYWHFRIKSHKRYWFMSMNRHWKQIQIMLLILDITFF